MGTTTTRLLALRRGRADLGSVAAIGLTQLQDSNKPRIRKRRIEVQRTEGRKRLRRVGVLGIVVLYIAPGDTSGVDPFASPVDWRGILTHGHLPENDIHGGEPTAAFP
mgnify:CR=1 FL=1